MSSGSIRRKDTDSIDAKPIDPLLVDFQTAQMLLLAMDNAHFQAEQAEANILTQFSSYKKAGDAYVRPQDLPLEENKGLTHASLDSHLLKVQSGQINEHGTQSIKTMEQDVNNKYKNKKVVIRVLEPELRPVHNCWFSQTTGAISYGNNRSKKINGKISEINLTKNFIILKPGLASRFVNKALVGYLIEVVNLTTARPMIEIEFN